MRRFAVLFFWLSFVSGCSSGTGTEVVDGQSTTDLSGDLTSQEVVADDVLETSRLEDFQGLEAVWDSSLDSSWEASPELWTTDVPEELQSDELDSQSGPLMPNYLVVSRESLLSSAQSWGEYRESCGYVVKVISVESILGPLSEPPTDSDVVEAVRSWVKERFDERDDRFPFFLLLVGDTVEQGAYAQGLIPSGIWPGLWQGCVSDNVYADMDGDHVPDLAVGRIPFRSTEQVDSLLERVQANEGSSPIGPWNHRLYVYAGDPGFGEPIDSAIETIARQGLESISYAWDILFTYRVESSAYYYAPFEEKILEFLTQGSVATLYMGHGGGELDVSSLSLVQCENRTPVVAFFACSTGEFFRAEDTDTELVLKNAHGPTAILASTATTHPYSNHVQTVELERAIFNDAPKTYGEAILRSLWMTMYNNNEERETWKAVAAMLTDAQELEDVIVDQMYVYALLGDPASPLTLPPASVTVTGLDTPRGATMAFEGTVSGLDQGQAHVELVCERARFLHDLVPVDATQPQNEDIVQQNWEWAMDHTVASADVPLVQGAFSGELTIPPTTPVGTYYLKVYAEDGILDAVGAGMVHVQAE